MYLFCGYISFRFNKIHIFKLKVYFKAVLYMFTLLFVIIIDQHNWSKFTFCSRKSGIKCWPQPNALNPCEDIMGFYWLRVSVWLVGISALMANLVVLLVVTRKKATNSVPRFLMSNLAFADFCTAVYLLLLAYEDLESSERYFNYAYNWQNGNYYIYRQISIIN